MRIAIGWMALCLAATPALMAQQAANPMVSSAKEIYSRQAANIAAAVEEMPADKFGYRPTPDQWTFGKIAAHIAQSNDRVCGMLTAVAAPDGSVVTETSPKPALAAALKASFDYCAAALDALQDSQLGDTITFFGGVKKPRARALVELPSDLGDHYSQLAAYLRLNGMLPPSATPKK
jgi:uncharacterized damage-inducible protein DinB